MVRLTTFTYLFTSGQVGHFIVWINPYNSLQTAAESPAGMQSSSVISASHPDGEVIYWGTVLNQGLPHTLNPQHSSAVLSPSCHARCPDVISAPSVWIWLDSTWQLSCEVWFIYSFSLSVTMDAALWYWLTMPKQWKWQRQWLLKVPVTSLPAQCVSPSLSLSPRL